MSPLSRSRARRRTWRAGHERSLRHSRLLQRARHQCRGVHRRRLLPNGRDRRGSAAATPTPKVAARNLTTRGATEMSCDEKIENLIFRLPLVKEVSRVAMPDRSSARKRARATRAGTWRKASRYRGPHRALACAADRVIQIAGGARGHGVVPDQSSRQVSSKRELRELVAGADSAGTGRGHRMIRPVAFQR